jgi:hypothetical protein
MTNASEFNEALISHFASGKSHQINDATLDQIVGGLGTGKFLELGGIDRNSVIQLARASAEKIDPDKREESIKAFMNAYDEAVANPNKVVWFGETVIFVAG